MNPKAPLVLGADGNFYGTTVTGGTYFEGNVFQVTPSGGFTSLYSFCAEKACPDGSNPEVGLTLGSDGNFYGTTEFNGYGAGSGTIFRITSGGTLTTLHSFHNPGGSELLQGANGIFYGTDGGGVYGFGTIFSLNSGLPANVQTVPTTSQAGSTVLILGTNLTGASSVTFNGATIGPLQVITPGGMLRTNAAFGILP